MTQEEYEIAQQDTENPFGRMLSESCWRGWGLRTVFGSFVGFGGKRVEFDALILEKLMNSKKLSSVKPSIFTAPKVSEMLNLISSLSRVLRYLLLAS